MIHDAKAVSISVDAMPANTLLLLVEGPHDLEFCARLLKPQGFSRIKMHDELKVDHPFWLKLVPQKWPHRGDMLARHPVPVFFANQGGQSVAIINAAGIDKLAKRLGVDLKNLNGLPDSIGIVLDADSNTAPQARHDELLHAIAARPETEANLLSFPAQSGHIAAGPPRCGIFVMPDNESKGTLEDLLLEAAKSAYPQLLQAARSYTASASQQTDLQQNDLEEFNKPAGSNKAIIAAMTAILKPGKAVQVSIQDNRWLEAASLQLPRVRSVKTFLDDLLD